MDWLQFISSMTGHLAWPIAAIGIAFIFREKIRELLEKMKRLKGPGGLEADFTEDVKKVVQEAKQVQAESAAATQTGAQFGTPTAIQGPPPLDEKDRLYELIRERPAALIVDAWRDVERAMLDVIGAKGMYVPPVESRNPANWPRHLLREGFITHETAALIADLRQLRNRVAHARDWEPTVADALDYHRSAKLVTDVLRQKVNEFIAQQGKEQDDQVEP